MGDQRRGGGFAVGSGDRDEGRIRRQLRPLAAEQLDIADDLDPCGLRLRDAPVRHGMGERHAGREYQRGKARKIRLAQIRDRDALRPHGLDPLGIVVESVHPRATGHQRAGGGQPGSAEAEQGDVAPGEDGRGGHADLLISASASPARSSRAPRR